MDKTLLNVVISGPMKCLLEYEERCGFYSLVQQFRLN